MIRTCSGYFDRDGHGPIGRVAAIGAVTVVRMAEDQGFGFDLDAPRRVSLTRLVGEIARQLAGIGSITVEGEVHQAKVYGGGRVYFTLKDRASQLSVVVPAGRKQFARVRDGERVAVTGKLQMLPDRGQLQLEAREVSPVGEGAIAAALADRKSVV